MLESLSPNDCSVGRLVFRRSTCLPPTVERLEKKKLAASGQIQSWLTVNEHKPLRVSSGYILRGNTPVVNNKHVHQNDIFRDFKARQQIVGKYLSEQNLVHCAYIWRALSVNAQLCNTLKEISTLRTKKLRRKLLRQRKKTSMLHCF